MLRLSLESGGTLSKTCSTRNYQANLSIGQSSSLTHRNMSFLVYKYTHNLNGKIIKRFAVTRWKLTGKYDKKNCRDHKRGMITYKNPLHKENRNIIFNFA